MAFGKKKGNPSSRYSRRAEAWTDEEEVRLRTSADYRDEGYGVRDSYSRQASYGRPEGYYDAGETGRRASASGGPVSGDTRVMPERTRTDAVRTAQANAYREEQMRRQQREDRKWTGDDWDEPAYDDRLDTFARRGRADRGGTDHLRTDSAYDRPKRESGRRGFAWKLVLLLLASAVLLLFWRFSRMERSPLHDILKNAGITGHDNVQDFVLYGVDSREGKLTEEAHSDTIILCSMNKRDKTVKLVSVYRDTYLDNTNGEYRKATECYYFGGPSRSVNMLNKNLDLSLDDYLTVDFNAVVKAVDLIGGVDVEVTEDELPYINGYQTENAEVTGAQITPVEAAGYQHLNGIQALAYCRIRYTEGSDYRRTERQRTVLSQVFERAKAQGPVRMAQIVDAMLPGIATSFSNTELLNLAARLQDYTISETTGFPFEQQPANISAGDCVVPVNLAQNVSELHAYLYGEQGYVPSRTVQEISDRIAAETGLY